RMQVTVDQPWFRHLVEDMDRFVDHCREPPEWILIDTEPVGIDPEAGHIPPHEVRPGTVPEPILRWAELTPYDGMDLPGNRPQLPPQGGMFVRRQIFVYLRPRTPRHLRLEHPVTIDQLPRPIRMNGPGQKFGYRVQHPDRRRLPAQSVGT